MKTRKKFVTPFNFEFDSNTHAETVQGISMTVPDMNMSLQEILQKFTRGSDPMLTKLGKYEFQGDEGIDTIDDDFDFSDLTSIDDAIKSIEDIEQERKALEQWIADKQKEKAKENQPNT